MTTILRERVLRRSAGTLDGRDHLWFLWRALKELGATTLRDGVTLLPASDTVRI